MTGDERSWGTGDGDDEEFDQLIEQSSLGTAGARELRARTSDAQVTDVRRRLAAAEGKSRRRAGRQAILPAAVVRTALVQMVVEMYRDELLAHAGYRPGVDDADELLKEIVRCGAIVGLYRDELLAHVGYRPGVDDADELLNEIALESSCA